MQNRYAGDVGDFGKYGLLRAVCNGCDQGVAFTLGIVWYLVPDENHNDDGRHISYLEKAAYTECDAALLDAMRHIVSQDQRTVASIPLANIFPSETVYFDEPLSFTSSQGRDARLTYRNRWLTAALAATQKQDVVFLDPDNGLEVPSAPPHTPKGPKYVSWAEAKAFLKRDQTVIIYHHLNRRSKAREQMETKVTELRAIMPGREPPITVLFRRGSLRAFFVCPARRHSDMVKHRIATMLESPWSQHLEVVFASPVARSEPV